MVRRKKFLPNVMHRICTSELKIRTCDRWIKRELGAKEWRDIIGFRYDEPRRWSRAVKRRENGECRHRPRDFPLVAAGVTKAMVEEYWKAVPWGLRMDSNYGNCDLCYLKGKRKIVSIIREKPELADWWIKMENVLVDNRSEKALGKAFMKDSTYRDLKVIATSGPALHEFEGDSPHDDIPCFCTD